MFEHSRLHEEEIATFYLFRGRIHPAGLLCEDQLYVAFTYDHRCVLAGISGYFTSRAEIAYNGLSELLVKNLCRILCDRPPANNGAVARYPSFIYRYRDFNEKCMRSANPFSDNHLPNKSVGQGPLEKIVRSQITMLQQKMVDQWEYHLRRTRVAIYVLSRTKLVKRLLNDKNVSR